MGCANESGVDKGGSFRVGGVQVDEVSPHPMTVQYYISYLQIHYNTKLKIINQNTKMWKARVKDKGREFRLLFSVRVYLNLV